MCIGSKEIAKLLSKQLTTMLLAKDYGYSDDVVELRFPAITVLDELQKNCRGRLRK